MKRKLVFWLHVLVSLILAAALFIGSFYISYNAFKVEISDIKEENVAVSDEDPKCYYLHKADPNINFKVRCELADEPYKYTLTDSNEKKVKTEIIKGKDYFVIMPPEKGYKGGETYTLILADDTYFDNSILAGAKKLIFTIDHKGIENYKYKENVYKIETPLNLDSSGRLIMPTEGEYKAGDILLGTDDTS